MTATPPTLFDDRYIKISDFDARVLSLVRDEINGVFTIPASAALPATIEVGDTGSAGTLAIGARYDHEHPVGSPTAISTLDMVTAATNGTSAVPAREDHVHGISTPSVVSDLQTGIAAATVGTSGRFARQDHIHGCPAGTPSTIGQANAEGIATTFARSDHVHKGLAVLVAERKSNTATGAGFQNLFSVQIPANTLGTGKGVQFEYFFRLTTGVAAIAVRITYGSTTMVTHTGTATTPYHGTGVLFGDGATNAQRCHSGLFVTLANEQITGTAAVDSTQNQNLQIDVDFVTDTDVATADWFAVYAIAT